MNYRNLHLGAEQAAICSSVLDAIGNTPLISLQAFGHGVAPGLYGKLESTNPGGSMKDRAALGILQAAEASGALKPGGTVVEGTAGNTGIGLAHLCNARGYRCVIVIPETQSAEKIELLRSLGAEVRTVPAVPYRDPNNYVKLSGRIAEEIPGAIWANQFDNRANRQAHFDTTGPEIWNDCSGRIDAIVTGVGTGGTITGVTRFMRRMNPDFVCIAVEPEDSPVIGGGEPGPHKIQGIGAGFVPTNLDTSLLDGVEAVSNDDAFEFGRRLARHEGIMGGISSGANVATLALIPA